jgi:UDP-N-acetylmuramoyl-tripeptide--D-alanyl-D-alanine ligase
MEKLSAAARRLGTVLSGADSTYLSVTTDTRHLQRGDLFVALSGDNFDGHEFVRRAGSLGAVGAIVSRPIACELPQIVVPQENGGTLAALQKLAASWRADFKLPVVAVTGSNGKTTTKQMLAAILRARGPVLATEGNLNNHIGVPLTLLRLRAEHATAVIEMGANHPGEIAALVEIARPDMGVVTQAGDAHLEGFGSREGVARAKGELFAGLRGGLAAINRDDHFYPLWKQLASGASILSFGLHEQADVRALHVESVAGTAMRFELRAPGGSGGGHVSVELPLPGQHNVANALAAATIAIGLGMTLDDIAAGLARVRGASGRVSTKTTPEGARLIDDSYNANPSSLAAALELLAGLPGERIAVLGDMAELGPQAAQLHLEAGQKARALKLDGLFTLGKLSAEATRGFGPVAQHFGEIDLLVQALRPRLRAGVSVLVKGSRSARMERVVAALLNETPAETH